MRNVYKMKPSGIRCLLSSVLAVVSMAITGTNVAEAQGLSVSGRVTDARGGEISGATVIVKGDNTRGTTTDAQGQYAIEVLSSDDVLVFSFLGYKTAEVAVRGRKTLNVQLEEDATLVDEVVVVGYGTQKRQFLVGSVSQVSSKELLKAPMTNVTITCTDGFQTDRPASTNPVSVVVRCHDLTTLTPVARPRFLKTGYGASGATYYDWQGYDVHKNRLYYTEGQSNYNLFGSFYSGSSFAYVTVFDFEGNIVEERTQVAVVSDKDKLTQIGVSVFGTLEAEGIKVCKDKLYLGYTARGITADNTKHYQNIFVFDPSSK